MVEIVDAIIRMKDVITMDKHEYIYEKSNGVLIVLAFQLDSVPLWCFLFIDNFHRRLEF